MKEVFSFNWDCGRSGHIEGLFISTDEEIATLIGKKLYFGEVLGKHSEIYGVLEENEISKVYMSFETIEELLSVFGNTISGYNPLDYIQDEESI